MKPVSEEKLSYQDYDARPGMRASYLAAAYQRDTINVGKAEYERTHHKDTAALRWGSALHTMLLEPERFAADYTVGDGPINPKTGKPYGGDTQKYLEWSSTQPKPIISREEYALLLGMSEAVGKHPKARAIRDEPRQTELSLFWSLEGIPCKARLDCLFTGKQGVLWDLKTARDASPRGFFAAVVRYNYHMKAAWYSHGWAQLHPGEPRPTFKWLAVENTPPYALCVYTAGLDLLNIGWDRCLAALAAWRECSRQNYFTSSYSDEEVLLSAAPWMVTDETEGE